MEHQELQRISREISQKVSLGQVLKRDNELEISLYTGVKASVKEIATNMARLRAVFPKMTDSFFNILAERIVINNFTSNRLKDAINQVIDNFQYKELNVSDIIQFDKRIKLYSYNDVCNLVTKNQAVFDDFEIREVDGRTYRVKKTDL